jgi:hypothetical protein
MFSLPVWANYTVPPQTRLGPYMPMLIAPLLRDCQDSDKKYISKSALTLNSSKIIINEDRWLFSRRHTQN